MISQELDWGMIPQWQKHFILNLSINSMCCSSRESTVLTNNVPHYALHIYMSGHCSRIQIFYFSAEISLLYPHHSYMAGHHTNTSVNYFIVQTRFLVQDWVTFSHLKYG
jgi:hypothetical protein